MLWLSAAVVAVVSNLDNLTVGVGLGIRGRPVTPGPNLVIAAVTMAGTAGAIASGHALSRVVPAALASTLGASIIIAIGAWSIAGWLRAVDRGFGASAFGPRSGRDRRFASAGVDSDDLGLREAAWLGVALALNNVGSGIGAGAVGISPLLTTGLAGTLSLLFVGGGSRLGSQLGRRFAGPWAPLASGMILLAVGAAALSNGV